MTTVGKFLMNNHLLCAIDFNVHTSDRKYTAHTKRRVQWRFSYNKEERKRTLIWTIVECKRLVLVGDRRFFLESVEVLVLISHTLQSGKMLLGRHHKHQLELDGMICSSIEIVSFVCPPQRPRTKPRSRW